MPFNRKPQKFNASIKEVTIGCGEKAVTLGGENVYPFYSFDGEITNAPKVAVEISDMGVPEVAGLKAYYEGCSTMAEIAKRASEMEGADFVCLRLEGGDPNGANKSVDELIAVVKEVADAIDVPLAVEGCKNVEKDGELLHYTDQPMEVGTEVQGRIDWARRFDLMQQHSGEHMVSGIIHEKYGYDNVGFHMGSDVITVDLNGMLDDAQLAEIEREVNERVWEDKEVKITYPDAEELKTIDYRSKKELTGQVRIVTFPGVDVCACCGTHVTHTGEIGMVKLLSVVKFHDGIRMEMICGKRVLDYLNMVNEQNHQISMKLSAKMDRTADAVQRLQDENFRMKGQVARMEEEMFRAEAKKWEGAGSVLIFKEGLEADSVRKLADAVMNTCEGCCAVFSRNEDGSYKYAMGEIDGDLRQYTKEMNAALNGRGGGKPFFVQGSAQATEDEIRNFFEK